MKKAILQVALLLAVVVCLGAQSNDDPTRHYLGEPFASRFLESALSGGEFNIAGNRELVPDQKTAVSIAQAILFSIYGEETIVSERPYEIHKLRGYWIIFGTLPKGWHGGTFKIIIDAKTARIILVGHDK
jgi:hypothetical protein